MKKIKKRTWFVIAAMINIIWYTIVVLVINAHGNEVQSELTIAWFAAWTAELALLAGLKVNGKTTVEEGE